MTALTSRLWLEFQQMTTICDPAEPIPYMGQSLSQVALKNYTLEA